jgi:hypothetical protein
VHAHGKDAHAALAVVDETQLPSLIHAELSALSCKTFTGCQFSLLVS